MLWNWQLPSWPKFTYNPNRISQKERQFLLDMGGCAAFLKTINKQDYNQFLVEILSQEGAESSKIEGEILDRESLQSSIQRHFGLQQLSRKPGKKELAVAELLCNVYESFNQPLTHEMLWKWHFMLFKDSSHLDNFGKYRHHTEPMQIVSHRYDRPKVSFEAPPSQRVFDEMTLFINWFNSTEFGPTLERAAIAHLYFESIHPFEDGNGRIGRALVEKILSQGAGRPVLIAVSKILERRKKEYYSSLGQCNTTLEVDSWVEFFADVILEAKEDSMLYLKFLIEKAKLFTVLAGSINSRQEKALLRMFESGPEGFKGGLSAEKYIAITKASRATATRDLADLVSLGALVKTGEFKHTRYWLQSS